MHYVDGLSTYLRFSYLHTLPSLPVSTVEERRWLILLEQIKLKFKLPNAYQIAFELRHCL